MAPCWWSWQLLEVLAFISSTGLMRSFSDLVLVTGLVLGETIDWVLYFGGRVPLPASSQPSLTLVLGFTPTVEPLYNLLGFVKSRILYHFLLL